MDYCEACGQPIDPDQFVLDSDLHVYHKTCYNQRIAEQEANKNKDSH